MDNETGYYVPKAILPPQTAMVSGQSVVTSLYAVMPSSILADNVLSFLPGWSGYRCWILCAPAMGAHVKFAQYLMYLEEGGGSPEPEAERTVESFIFVLQGSLDLTVAGKRHALADGGFAFVPSETTWSIRANGPSGSKFLWLRKEYEPYNGPAPKLLVGNERDVPITRNPKVPTKWLTQLIPANDIAYDFHMNIGSMEPGAIISLAETHVMEHSEYFLQGKGLYLLNERWHEVQAGDFIWMRAFCPQAFYAAGPTTTRSLLYKNVNRQVVLTKERPRV